MGSSIQFFLPPFLNYLRSLLSERHMVYNVGTRARGRTFKWSSGAAQSQHHQHRRLSTRLNERCKRGTTKKAHAVPKPMGAPPSLQSRSVCPDPSVGIRICSSKTHTAAWNCYKAHCLLSQTGFVRAALPVCEWLFVRRLSLFETCSLIPAHALCVRADSTSKWTNRMSNGYTGQPPFSHPPSVKLNVDRRQYRQEAQTAPVRYLYACGSKLAHKCIHARKWMHTQAVQRYGLKNNFKRPTVARQCFGLECPLVCGSVLII